MDCSPKHYTLFTPFKTMCFVPDHYAVVLDNAEDLAEQGNQVDLVYCDGKAIQNCIYNCYGDKKLCKACVRYQRYFHKHITHKEHIKATPVSQFLKPEMVDFEQFTQGLKYQTIDEVKEITHKGAHIGLAAVSSYLTLSRNLDPLIDGEFRDFMNRYLFMSARTTDLAEEAIRQLHPDSVACFNGRLICNRPIVDLCINSGMPFQTYEVGYNEENRINKKIFDNNLPHDPETNTRMINALWESEGKSKEERIATAKRFFEKRRNAIVSGDKVAYTKNQSMGLLPADWDDSKINISIFNSSEDEFASLGEKFAKLSLFPSQLTGIKYIFEKFKDNEEIHFYLRVHPNLTKVNYKYHKSLYELNQYKNVTIIPADSKISTYTLVDSSDKVIVFGSSVGFEAAYANKPVILLGCTMYRELGICYVAHSTDELDQLILDKELKPLDNLGALKFAYYIVNSEFPMPKYFADHKKATKSILGKKFILTRSVIRDSSLSPYISYFYQILGKYLWSKSKCSYPTKERE